MQPRLVASARASANEQPYVGEPFNRLNGDGVLVLLDPKWKEGLIDVFFRSPPQNPSAP
jgi:hypothetical protein